MRVDVVPDSSIIAANEQWRRKNRLIAILDKGLPPFRHTVIELSSIFGDPSVDIRKAANTIRTDPSFTANVLRMCNSPLFGRHSRVVSIEQAAALLGAKRLRSLAVTGSFASFSGKGLPEEQVEIFWRHSVLAALLSKKLAEYTRYPEPEQAYIAGLLHDIGEVPLWMLTAEEPFRYKENAPEGWSDDPIVQRRRFGIDHCELGSRMARLWRLMPSFADVILKHHEPLEAEHDPYLVQIVAGVEHFLIAKEEAGAPSDATEQPTDTSQPFAIPSSTRSSRQPFASMDWHAIASNLEEEYRRVLPLVRDPIAFLHQ